MYIIKVWDLIMFGHLNVINIFPVTRCTSVKTAVNGKIDVGANYDYDGRFIK